ncbi:MAG: DinB family protein [Bryobacteraceae bacterium]|jgi:uncharacterized damage-inducible protein DinB
MSIGATLLPEFDQEMQMTRKLLACVPDDRPDYKPHAKSMPLNRLAGHVAELPNWATNTIKLEVLDLTPASGEGFKPFFMTSKEGLLEAFDKNVAEARAAIAGASDEDLSKIWSLVYQGQTVLQMPRAAVLRTVVMNHLIHHRAQLGVYLRMNDIAIPGMYGPSADEARMFQAAT